MHPVGSCCKKKSTSCPNTTITTMWHQTKLNRITNVNKCVKREKNPVGVWALKQSRDPAPPDGSCGRVFGSPGARPWARRHSVPVRKRMTHSARSGFVHRWEEPPNSIAFFTSGVMSLDEAEVEVNNKCASVPPLWEPLWAIYCPSEGRKDRTSWNLLRHFWGRGSTKTRWRGGQSFWSNHWATANIFELAFFNKMAKKSIFAVKAKNAWRAQPALNNEKLKTRGSVREEKNEVGLDTRRRSAGCHSEAWGARWGRSVCSWCTAPPTGRRGPNWGSTLETVCASRWKPHCDQIRLMKKSILHGNE